MKILAVNNAEPVDAAFNQPLIDAVSSMSNLDVIFGAELPVIQEDIATTYDAVIVSGVPRHYAFETIDPLRERLEWLRDIDMPTLGICLGHQAIGTLFGAELIRDREAELGKCTVSVHADDPIFAGLERTFVIDALHRASISVPEDFVLLASTSECQNQIMRHTDRPIYGMQFHPELSATGIRLLKNFVQLASERKVAAATAPLAVE